MAIVINDVYKAFAGKSVLENISLTAKSGEILCLLGPSGAGKTTLIRLITGSIAPCKGDITIDDYKVPNPRLMEKTGFMPQQDALYNDISGYDNILFFARLHGIYGKELRAKADEALGLVKLLGDKNKLVAHYSGGMKRRLSLAIALVHNPDILLLDEPTVGIDPVLKKAIWTEFEVLRGLNKTIVVSTHVMDEAMRCQRAALIYDGKLIEADYIENLVAKTPQGSLEDLFINAAKAGGES